MALQMREDVWAKWEARRRLPGGALQARFVFLLGVHALSGYRARTAGVSGHRQPPVRGSAEYYRDALDRSMAQTKAHKDRMEDIVRSLQAIQALLKIGAGDAALAAMTDLMGRDLKQSKERVQNQDFALTIAINALQLADRYNDESNERVDAALAQIKTLAPESFQPDKTPVASA
jgi:flagellar biosynthesis regulator FlaF